MKSLLFTKVNHFWEIFLFCMFCILHVFYLNNVIAIVIEFANVTPLPPPPLTTPSPYHPPYHPLPLPPPLPPPLTPTEQFRRKNVDLSVRDFNWLNIHPIGLLLIGVTKKKLSYFCLQRTTCITQENEARNLNTSIRSQMIFGILEHMKLKS